MNNSSNKVPRLTLKKQLLSISIIAGMALSGASMAIAKQDAQGHFERPDNNMRIFKQLELTAQQKLDIKALMRKTKEDNSVYAGEKVEVKKQMQALMSMPAWDEQTARQTISALMQQSKEIQLNRAEAKHAIYQVLTDDQKEQLAEKMEKRQNKRELKAENNGERNGDKRKAKMQARIFKKLALSVEQQTQWQAIREQSKAERTDFAPFMQAHREQIKAILYADTFDTNAWQAAHDNFADEFLAHRVQMAEAKYNTMAMLSDEQKAKFKKMTNKMKEKGRK